MKLVSKLTWAEKLRQVHIKCLHKYYVNHVLKCFKEQLVAYVSFNGLGAFVGVSLEGNIVATRMDANLQFYGDPYVTTTDILLGTVDRPKAAEPLYAALDGLYAKLRCYPKLRS